MNNNKINTGGWFEKPDFLLGKAKKHSQVAEKKEFQKEFGKQPTSIMPMEKGNVALHFEKISEKDYGTFCETSLKFANENGIKVNITNEGHSVVVILPKQQALPYHDFILAKHGEIYGCDFEDLLELVDFKGLEAGKGL